jgi:hypothetical protein
MQDQSVIKIAKELDDRITGFLNTKQALKMGLESKKAVVNIAVSEFLDKYERLTGEEQYKNLVKWFERNPQLLKKMGFKSTGQLIESALTVTERQAEQVK